MSDEDTERLAKLERVRAIRRGNRGVITKLTKEVDDLLSKSELDAEAKARLRVIFEQLEGKSKLLSNLDSEVLSLCGMDDIEREIDESEVITAKVIELKRRVDSAVNPPTTRGSSGSPAVVMLTVSDRTMKPKLPKLSLAKFRGDVTSWSAFWDSYQSAIHENPSIAVIDKFNYLHSLLEGPAARTIQGLALRESNYEPAVKLLKERFGKPQQIISAHMEELIKISPCTGERPSSLRYVFDKINVNMRGLSAMGISSTQYGSLLIPIVMSKIIPELRLRIARETKKDIWEMGELLELIKQEVEARESSEQVKIHVMKPQGGGVTNRGSNNYTASSLISNTSICCVYCNESHYSASCKRVSMFKIVRTYYQGQGVASIV